MNSDLVRYVCRSEAHLEASRNGSTAEGSPVTINDGAWAYCPAGARSDHRWDAIEPVTLAGLKLIDAALPREGAAEESRS